MICKSLTRTQANGLYLDVMHDEDEKALRELCTQDLFFLLTIGCKRKDINNDWLYECCREVESEPDENLDIWAREHYKSTIITFGKTIQDVLDDPDETVGILSHTRPIAKGFLGQIKTEFEQNTFLKNLFPDVLYAEPQKQSPKWSLDSGLRVKRRSNPKEETIEAWGLVDGQPTGKHFKIMVYDDVVTRESVTTPDQIKKTTEALELSYNLGAQGGRRRFIGTRYHLYDSYKTIIDRGTAKPRIKPATHNGQMDGQSVFMPQELLMQKRRDMGPYTFSCQMLQNPVADKAMSFKPEWQKYYEKLGDTSKWNKYMLVDPANSKKKSSDYTVIEVIGLAPDNNYYLLDAIRDRLNLTQRTNKVFEMHRKWLPCATGYERYGKDADIEHIQYEMEIQNYRFSIIELGGSTKKEDRILRLVPIYEQGRFYSPKTLIFIDNEGNQVDYVKVFNEDEYNAFPVVVHDDMLDCRARILEPNLNAKFPKLAKTEQPEFREYEFGSQGQSWMG